MTRIVGGAARGRRLRVPPGGSTRPTSDRAREALFSTVEAVLGPLTGRSVLDLYAGSGAVGLEALSRGAAHVTLVESDPRAAAVLRANAALVEAATAGAPGAAGTSGGEGGRAVVRRAGVERLVAGPADVSYDVVFADPPYAVATRSLHRVLADLRSGGWLAPGALVVVERATRDLPWTWPEGFAADRERRYGEGTLWYGRAATTSRTRHPRTNNSGRNAER